MEIEFTKEKANRLHKHHDKAVKENKDIFVFDGNEYVTKYAFYLLQYLDNKFNNKK